MNPEAQAATEWLSRRDETASRAKGRVSSFRHTALLARKEFSDRFRSGWVVACVLVWLGAICLTSIFGLVQIGRIGVQGYERTVMSLLSVVQYLVPLLALLLGQDLIVSEREERTLALLVAGGIGRGRLLLGKLLGGILALGFPLLLGFAIAGTVIGVATRDRDFKSFCILAGSGLVLGIVFLAIGLALSTLCRSRVQALVLALLSWCFAVFAFDLIALGALVSLRTPVAAHEIDVLCDPTHVNTIADLHAAYEAPVGERAGATVAERASALSWVMANPIDLFRAVNLSSQMPRAIPPWVIVATIAGWLALSILVSFWKFRRVDL